MDEPTQLPPVEGGEPTPVVVPEPGAMPDPTALGEGGKSALDKERADRKAAERDLKEANARLKEIEDAQKTEAERLADDASASRAQLAETQARLRRVEAATAAGLSLDDADRLRGTTAEELAADAAALAERWRSPAPVSFDGGPRTPPPAVTLADQIAAAEKDGDYKTAIHLKAQQLAALSGRASGA